MTLEDPGSVDVVAHDPEKDEVLLVMIEYRPWGETAGLLHQLQGKMDTYLSYALDGQLGSDYPELRGKPVHIQVRTVHPPGRPAIDFMREVSARHLQPAGIRFSWKQVGQKPEHFL